jgi:hypothetical protein
MKMRPLTLALTAIGIAIVVPAVAAFVVPGRFALTDKINTPRIAAVARQHPNFTVEQRSAVQREIEAELHPLWKDLSVSERLARITRFAMHFLLSRGAGASASTVSSAQFLGNLTAIAAPSGEALGLQRQSNCSLSLYNGNLTLGNNPSNQILGTTANYELVLHDAAALTTHVDAFSNGCVDPTLGIGSRRSVYLGRTTQNESLIASFGYNNVTGNNALYYGTVNPNSMAVSNLSSDSSLPGIAGVAAGDLNGDGMADIIGIDATSASIAVWLAGTNGSIGTATLYALPGNMTEAAVVADVNGDGNADVVVATRSTSGQETISVLTGKGDGTLNTAQSFPVPTPSAPNQGASTTIANLVAADLRGSGRLDIVATNGLVLLNDGSGTFTVGTSAFSPVSSESSYGPNLASGDFNNDGKPDLAVSNGTAISLFLGNGDGTFTAGKSYASIDDVGYVTATDLDGDGNTDLYVGLANGGAFGGDQYGEGQAYALMGNGDGSFQGAPVLPFVYNGNNVVDLTGSGILDAVGVNSNSSITSYLGDGKGGFSAGSTLAISPVTIGGQQYTVSGIDSYAFGDVNGDGHPDLAYIANGFNGPAGTPGVFVALGNGQGGFATPSFYAVPSTLASGDIDINWTIYNLHVADVNKDGKADLIYNYSDTSSKNNTINFGTVVQLSNGDGTYQAPLVIPYRSEAYSNVSNPTETSYVQLITDLNHDGIPDLVFITQSSTIDQTLSTYVSSIQVALGKGDGTFSTPTAVAGPNIMVQSFTDLVPASIAVADMNGDGIPDIVALGAASTSYDTQVAVALGNGDGTFKAPILTTYTTQYLNNAQGIAVADFNGDGKPDVAMTDPYDPTGSGISLGNGDGTLQTASANGTTLPNLAINLIVSGAGFSADFNGDGKPDLLAGNVLLLSEAAAAVGTAATTTSLASAAASITTGQPLTLTATVAATSGSIVPTGTVTFLDGTTTLGLGTLGINGSATYTTSSLTAGSQTLTASYGGSATFAGSSSSAITVTVTAGAPDFTAALSSSSGTVAPGQSATTTVTLTPSNGFSQTVALSCSGLPTGATCSFAPASVGVTGSAATSTLTIATAAATALNSSHQPFNPLVPGAVSLAGLFGLPMVLRRRRTATRWLRRALLALLCVGAGTLLQSCGGGNSGSGSVGTGSGGTPAGTYTLTVTASAGSTTHSATYSLTVN